MCAAAIRECVSLGVALELLGKFFIGSSSSSDVLVKLIELFLGLCVRILIGVVDMRFLVVSCFDFLETASQANTEYSCCRLSTYCNCCSKI